MDAPRILPCGDAALTVEFGAAIDPALHARVTALDDALAKTPVPGIVETVPTYRSLLVTYDPSAIRFDALAKTLRARAAEAGATTHEGTHWRLPVVYGGRFGIDLEAVAARHGLTPDAVVARHSGATYRVYMIGFMPGFTYLGGLDPAIATPRLDVPRLRTPAGSVSIGGVQAAVASIEIPSGWHLLGRTPVRTFMPTREPAFFLAPGDRVTFQPVDESDWAPLAERAEAGDIVAERMP